MIVPLVETDSYSNVWADGLQVERAQRAFPVQIYLKHGQYILIRIISPLSGGKGRLI
jgi:hypothetical protein